MSKKMLIDARHPEETRVAVLSGGKVEDFDFESQSRKPLRGNIYLARVTRVEPSLQAAFVEYGGNRHGFLAFSEIHPDYYQIPVTDRETLRAAEELEAELAAKLADLDRSIDTDDGRDDDIDDDGGPADHGDGDGDEEETPRARSKADDADPDGDNDASAADGDGESRPKRRRRRGGRGRSRRNRGDDTTNDEDSEAAAKADAQTAEVGTDDTDTNTGTAETATEDDNAAVGAAVVATAATETPADYVAGDEDPVWHAADEDVIAALPTEATTSEETAADTGADVDAADDTENDGEGEDGEEPDDRGNGPASIALPARLEPSVTAPLPDDDTETAAHADDGEVADDPEPSAVSVDEPSSIESAASDLDPAADVEDAEEDGDAEGDASAAGPAAETAGDEGTGAADQETDEDDGGTGETEARTDVPDQDGDDADEGDSDDDSGASDNSAADDARNVADLQKRYEAARRERDRLLKNYRIQEVIKRRQIMLVQVVKEERGNKGAALTTYLSLAGRYGVLMPNNSRGGGVSRKISNQSDRKRLRKAMQELSVPKGQGLIIRTAGAKRTKAEIKRDYDYLARLWDTIRGQTLKSVAPCLIYEEASLIKRAIRDLYDKDTSEILVEGEEGYREAKDFMKMLMPSHAKNVQPYREKEPLFLRYGVERQLDEMYQPVVNLKSGGYLVIQQTEALISIDVNSGKATKERNVEATAVKTNSEAAVELARQCRLRDLAGLLVVDFIDMEENRNNRSVEKKLKDAMKTDRARIQLGSISNFGLLEMSRQRRRSGIVDGTTRMCPTCEGAGNVRSVEMAALRILRAVEEKTIADNAGQVEATTSLDVALYILNQKRSWLNRMEDSYGCSIQVRGDADKSGDQYEVETSGKADPDSRPARSAVVELADVVEAADAEADDDAGAAEPDGDTDAAAETISKGVTGNDEDDEAQDGAGRKRRRRRRRGRGKGSDDGTADDAQDASSETEGADASPKTADDTGTDDSETTAGAEASGNDGDGDADSDEDDGKPKRRRRRGRRGGKGRTAKSDADASDDQDTDDQGQPVGKEHGPEDTAVSSDAGSAAGAQENEEGEAASREDLSGTKADDDGTHAAAENEDDDVSDTAGDGQSADTPQADKAPRAAASIHAPVDPSSDQGADSGPKRRGWWQRAFSRD